MQRPRIGVVGAGWWSVEHHLPSLVSYPGAHLVAVVEPNPVKRSRVAECFALERTFAGVDELLDAGVAEALVVATPHALHYPIARTALDAGLHVLVEKPLALTGDQAWDLVELAAQRNLALMVGYTTQFSRGAQRLRQAFATGELGTPLCLSGVFASVVGGFFRGRPEEYQTNFDYRMWGPEADTYANPEISGGGQAVTQLTHAAALSLYATDLIPRRVSAFMANRELAVDLVDALAYDCSGGAVGTLAGAGTLRPGDPLAQVCHFFTTAGSASYELDTGRLAIQLADGSSEIVAPEAGQGYPAGRPARAFADLIAGRSGNPGPGVPAARTVDLIEASYSSAAAHVAVQLPSRQQPPAVPGTCQS